MKKRNGNNQAEQTDQTGNEKGNPLKGISLNRITRRGAGRSGCLLALLLFMAIFTAGCGRTGDGTAVNPSPDAVAQTPESESKENGGQAAEPADETAGGAKPEQEEAQSADLQDADTQAQDGGADPGKNGAEAAGNGTAAGDTQAAADAQAGDTRTQPGAEQAQTGNAWEGRKLSICGDSISTFTGYIPDYYSKFYPEMGEIMDVNDTWWMQVLQRTGMELLRNASYSGATVSGQSQDNHDGRYGCGNQRMADLRGEDGSSPDVILIMLGANDLLNSIPLGNYDGVSQVPEGNIKTFSEAYALMLDKMKTWYPDAELYCCTAAEVSRWDETGKKFPFENAHKLTMKDYNAWIESIAEKKGAKVIDVYNCGITYDNAPEYTSDGTHPNPAGAGLIADKVREAFGA